MNRKRTKACWLWQICGRFFLFFKQFVCVAEGVALGVTLPPPTVQIGYLPGKCCLPASNDASVGQTGSPQSCTGRAACWQSSDESKEAYSPSALLCRWLVWVSGGQPLDSFASRKGLETIEILLKDFYLSKNPKISISKNT